MIPECTGVKQNDTRMTRNLPDDSGYFWCIPFHSVPVLSNAQCTRALMFHHVTDQCEGVSWMRTISNAGKPRLKSHNGTQFCALLICDRRRHMLSTADMKNWSTHLLAHLPDLVCR